jgi:mono/diheme cytochrome c family protein
MADGGFVTNMKRVQIIVTLWAVVGSVVLAGLAWVRQNTSASAQVIAVAPNPQSAIRNPQSSVWDGVYTEEQAKRGEGLYHRECSSCHTATLTGGEQSPALAGAEFTSNWNGLSVGELFERFRVTMPPDRPERLSRQQKADILAYVLSVNKFPAGQRELARETQLLNQIRFEATKP